MKKPSRQYILYFVIIFASLFCLSGLRVYIEQQKMQNQIHDDVQDYFTALENRIVTTYEERLRDLVYMRELTESLLQAGADRWEIENFYYEFCKAMGIYDQIRYLDTAGNEIVRVNYEGGKPSIVARQELQNKANRYYFENLMELDHNGIYVSPLDLNMEHGDIEWPLKPMIRLGMPVQDINGNPTGFVMLNYLASDWIQTDSEEFAPFRDHIVEFNRLWIVNSDGYYLQHTDPKREWGFVFPERGDANLFSEYPELQARRNDPGMIKVKTTDSVLFMEKIPSLHPMPPYHGEAVELGYLVYHFPKVRYDAYFKNVKQEWIIWVGVSLFIAFLGAYFWENSRKSRQNMMDLLHHRANRDSLTGLLNKQGFLSYVPEAMKRWDDGISAIGYFDIDDFKSVNDKYGHAVGDEVLLEVGKRLKEVLRERDLPARIHGDEFNILLKLRKEIDSRVVARRLINRMKDPIETTAGEISVTVSLGIAFFHEGESFDEVTERADRLMYQVKRSGKSDYRIEGLA